MFAPKKDGLLRLCVDYWKLNAVTVHNAYPISRTDERIGSFGDDLIFSLLDAHRAYWQVEIYYEDFDETAFTSNHGPLRFCEMPLGLHNAPGLFQRTMNVILSPIKWQFALLYMDNTTIFSRNTDEHISHIRPVFLILHKDGVTLNLKECSLFTEKIEYLRHFIQSDKLEAANRVTEAIGVYSHGTTLMSWNHSSDYATYTGGLFWIFWAKLHSLTRRSERANWRHLIPLCKMSTMHLWLYRISWCQHH